MTTTTTKEEKDPNAPKRPMSAWLYWLGENRERLKEEAKARGENLLKRGGEEWKALEDKSKWEKMASKDKERYFREIGQEASPQPEASKKKPVPASTTKSSGKITKAKQK